MQFGGNGEHRMRVRRHWLIVGCGVWAAASWCACRDDDGCGDEQDPPLGVLDDTPRPSLCSSDTILLTPSELTFTLGSVDGGSAGSPTSADAGQADGGAQQESDAASTAASQPGGAASAAAGSDFEMAVEARRSTGQPRSTVTVFVSSEDAIAKLSPRRELSSGTSGECERVSDARLRCILDANGTAAFRVSTSANVVDGTRGIIRAESGTRYTTAIVHVGATREDFDALSLELGTARLTSIPGPIDCSGSPQTTLSCTTLVERDVTVEAVRNDDASYAGDAGAARALAPLRASLGVGISLTTSGLVTAWLATEECGKGARSDALVVQVDPVTLRHPPLRVCSNGAVGTVSVVARADSLRGPVVAPLVVGDLPGVPATVSIVPSADSGSSNYLASASDCMGGPLAGAVFTVGATGRDYDGGANGRAIIEIPGPDAATTTAGISVRNSTLNGSTANCGASAVGATQ